MNLVSMTLNDLRRMLTVTVKIDKIRKGNITVTVTTADNRKRTLNLGEGDTLTMTPWGNPSD